MDYLRFLSLYFCYLRHYSHQYRRIKRGYLRINSPDFSDNDEIPADTIQLDELIVTGACRG